MKIGKKLTFLGLAVLGTVSLASCDLAKYISDFANGVTGERSLEYTQVIPSSNQPSATVPSQITSTTTNKYNPTTTTTTNKYNPTTTTTTSRYSTTTSTKKDYTIRYSSYVDGMLDNSLMSNTDYTVGGYAKYPGYYSYPNLVFEGYFEDRYSHIPFDYTKPVYEDKIVYALFHSIQSTYYYKYKTDSTNLFSFDKDAGMGIQIGTGFDSNTPVIKVSSDNNLYVDSRGLYLYSSNATIDLGSINRTKKGIFDITFDVVFDAMAGETFFSIVGDSSKVTGKDVFGLYTSGGMLNYKLDGGSNISTNYSMYANITYSFHIQVDMSKGYLYVDNGWGENLIGCFAEINSIYGLKFTSKATGATPKSINNIAVNYYNYY